MNATGPGGQVDRGIIDAFNGKVDELIADIDGDGKPDDLDAIIEDAKKNPVLQQRIAELEQQVRDKDATIQELATTALNRMNEFKTRVQAYVEKVRAAKPGGGA